MLTLNNIHYNGKGVPQVSPAEELIDLEPIMAAIDSRLRNGSECEQKILSFFQREVEPSVAYKDNDVDQGIDEPKALYAVGKLKRIKDYTGLFIRIGISSPDESPLIPRLQALYLQEGNHTKHNKERPDRWFYSFTETSEGMIKGVKAGTELGINSISIIPAINEAILSDKKLKLPLYK